MVTAFNPGGKGGERAWVSYQMSLPEAKEMQATTIAMSISIDESLKLERYDAEGSNAVNAAIVQLIDQLREEAEEADGPRPLNIPQPALFFKQRFSTLERQ